MASVLLRTCHQMPTYPQQQICFFSCTSSCYSWHYFKYTSRILHGILYISNPWNLRTNIHQGRSSIKIYETIFFIEQLTALWAHWLKKSQNVEIVRHCENETHRSQFKVFSFSLVVYLCEIWNIRIDLLKTVESNVLIYSNKYHIVLITV